MNWFCCIASATIGAFLVYLGGTAIIVAALCFFMSGGFFVARNRKEGPLA